LRRFDHAESSGHLDAPQRTLLGTSAVLRFFGAGRKTSPPQHGPDDLGIWPNGQERGRFLAALERGGGMVSGFPLDVRRADGSTAHFVLSGRLIEVEGRKLLLKEFHDVTEATREANQLRRMAEHDALTGLPNRLLVSDRLRQALAAARRGGWQIAVCYLDLDGFKDVNDRHGHRAAIWSSRKRRSASTASSVPATPSAGWAATSSR
jgi:PAS domain-containing protein